MLNSGIDCKCNNKTSKKGGNMTRNQIEFWRNVETNRSNVAQEQETRRSNLARELETNRSNLANEKETNRHNLATERLSQIQSDRNWTLGLQSNIETQRANKAKEKETKRSNLAREQENTQARLGDQAIRRRQASTAQYDADTRRILAQETMRSNRNNEAIALSNLTETRRANISREQETRRSNVAREAESYRANITSENLRRRELSERERSNQANENISVRGQNLNFVTSIANALARKKSNSVNPLDLLKLAVR